MALTDFIEALPADETGKSFLAPDGSLFTGVGAELTAALSTGSIRFHSGAIRGALPGIAEE